MLNGYGIVEHQGKTAPVSRMIARGRMQKGQDDAALTGIKMGHQEHKEENKQATKVDDPISLRLGFAVKLLGGPNEDFECGSEGQQIPRKGTASSKARGCEVLPSSR